MQRVSALNVQNLGSYWNDGFRNPGNNHMECRKTLQNNGISYLLTAMSSINSRIPH